MIIQCPSSPRLIKSMSDLEEKVIIDDILNKLVNDVVYKVKSEPLILKKDLRFIKLQEKQQFITFIQNFTFYILLKFKLLIYFKLFTLDEVYYKTHNNGFKKETNIQLFCTEKYLKILNLKVYYEYIHTFEKQHNMLIIKLINKKSVFLKSKNTDIIYDLLIKNMHYHVRYNKIDYNLSKVIQFKKSVKVY